MRLFYAVVFTRELRDRLCGVLEQIRPCCESGRFTRPENLHLTLVFLGECPPGRLPAAREALAAVDAEAFVLRIGGLGCFRRSGGDLYWAGVERTPALLRVWECLCAQLRARGFRLEARSYRPHITLVRQAVLREGCDRGALAVPALKTEVEKLSLMRSDLSGGGPVYTEIGARRLGEGEAG